MPIDNRTVLRAVVQEVSAIDNNRVSNNKPIDYYELKDGMFHLHCAFQDLVMTVKAGKQLPESAVRPAVQLAAAAVKFVTDLCPAGFTQLAGVSTGKAG